MPPSHHEHAPPDHDQEAGPTLTTAWSCPTCGRTFRRAGQTHVCGTTTVEDHLHGKPAVVVALFHAFAQHVQAAGPVTYAPVKGQIGFRGPQRIFAGVKLTTRGLQGYLDLPRKVESPRFRRISPYTKRLFVHHFVLTDCTQLDAEFSGWIHEAYQVGAGTTVSRGE